MSISQVCRFNDKHSSSLTHAYPHIRNGTKNVVGDFIMEKLRDNNRINRGKEIINDFMLQLKVDLSYH